MLLRSISERVRGDFVRQNPSNVIQSESLHEVCLFCVLIFDVRVKIEERTHPSSSSIMLSV